MVAAQACLNLRNQTTREMVAAQACLISVWPVLLISLICIIDVPDDHSQLTSNPLLQGESKFSDSSEPLFSMYSRAAEDEDEKMVERWQKDAGGILIFVSPQTDRHPYCFMHNREHCRPVYSLPPSLRFFPQPYRTCGKILRNSTLGKSMRFLPARTQHRRHAHLSPLLSIHHRRFLHQDTLSGSIHSGF